MARQVPDRCRVPGPDLHWPSCPVADAQARKVGSMRYFTFRKTALAAKRAWQKLRFRMSKGYYLIGTRPPVPKTSFTMYDSVDIKQIPADAFAVAGYTTGNWPTFHSLAAAFPK